MTDTITLASAPAILRHLADLLEPGTTTTPAPVPGIVFPEGEMHTMGPRGQALTTGGWGEIARWEPLFTNAVKEAGGSYGPLLLACFAVIESGGNHYRHGGMTGRTGDIVLGGGSPPSVGIMQLVCGFHAGRLPDADCYTPEGNIRIGAHLLADWIKSEGSWEAALSRKWHPGTDPVSGYSPQTYIETVRKLIAEVKGESTTTAAPTPRNPFQRPVIYTLENDYWRWQLPEWKRNIVLGRRNANRNGREPRYMINHIQEGFTKGSLDHWATVKASSTVMAQKDGSLLRVIPEQHGPWTNGQICNPTPKSAGLRALGGDINDWCLTLEAEGDSGGAQTVTYTAKQLGAILWQFADWMIRYDLPLANVLSHASIDQCDRPHCPGEANMLRVLAELKQAGFK